MIVIWVSYGFYEKRERERKWESKFQAFFGGSELQRNISGTEHWRLGETPYDKEDPENPLGF